MMPLLARGIFLLPSDLMEKYYLNVDDIFENKKQNALRDLVEELTNVNFLKFINFRELSFDYLVLGFIAEKLCSPLCAVLKRAFEIL